ncbi:MAG: CocE/NonD family hydrolase [Proteobacteria bacterium]|nr:CocE/NonD family hydrolase [Pseudomonadota bacterium]
MKKGFLGIFVIMVLVVGGISFGSDKTALNERILSDDVKEQISKDLTDVGIFGAYVDLNMRMTIPSSDNPYTDEDTDLWGMVIKPGGNTVKRPTILVATAYRRELTCILYIGLLRHGYNLMVYDIRGTGSSNGAFDILNLEQHYDVAFIIDKWIPKQSWSDGKVGMIGASFLGITQLLAGGQIEYDAVTGEPVHLKAIFPQVAMTDAYTDTFLPGGVQNLFYDFWLYLVDMLSILPPDLYLGETYPPIPSDLEEANTLWKDHMNQFLDHWSLLNRLDLEQDGSFWDEKSPMIYWPDKPENGWGLNGEGEKVLSKKLPVCLTSGWFDVFTRGTLAEYQYGLKNHNVADKALIVGEWYHLDAMISAGLPSLTNMDFPARWFDWKIKGEDDCFMKDFPVFLEVMGENRWRAEKSWPLPEERLEEKVYYLSKKKQDPIEGDYFTHKPANLIFSLEESESALSESGDAPVMTHNPLSLHGGMALYSRSGNRFLAGAFSFVSQISKKMFGYDLDEFMPYEDERTDDWKIPTFTTDVLAEDMEIVGPLLLTFWAKTDFDDEAAAFNDQVTRLIKVAFGYKENRHLDSMNQKDVYWVVDLDDVFPEGRARNITSGWLSAKHRPYDPELPDGTQVNGIIEHALDPSYVPFAPFYDYPDRYLVPINEGDLYQYAVELWPTCNVFKKGHRVRITLSGSDFPHLLPIAIPSKSTIQIDESHQSSLAFTTTNTDDEGITWEWIDHADDYLMTHRDEPDSIQAEGRIESEKPLKNNNGTENSTRDMDEAATNRSDGMCFISSLFCDDYLIR